MKKIFCLLVSIALCGMGLVGCGTKKDCGPIRESDEPFRYVAYATPPNGNVGDPPFGAQPSDNTEENWKIMADVGYNYATPIWYDSTHEHILTTLENAQKVGLKVQIEDRVEPGLPSLVRKCAGMSYNEAMNEILAVEDALIARYDEYKKFDSFVGIVAQDEPSTEEYNALAAGQDWWREHYPGYEYFVNLFPSYASSGQLFGTEEPGTFSDYVNRFVDTVNPFAVSCDHYPLRRSGMKGTISPQWLSDMEVFAETSKANDIPFFLYIQTTQFKDRVGPTSYREFAWQAYSAMAYGVKGLQTFMYWSYLIPDNNQLNLGTSLVGPRGEILPCYYVVQEVFQEIQAFDQLYMNFDWEGTMPVGLSGSGTFALLRNPLKSLAGIESVESNEDALVGQFKDGEGNQAYMVVNYSSPFEIADSTVTLKFKDAKRVLICKKGRLLVKELSRKTLDLKFGSGEGCFVIPL